jgi:hypothetical protein
MDRPSNRKRLSARRCIPFRWKLPKSEPPQELEAVLRATFKTMPEPSRRDYTYARVSSREQMRKQNLG